MTRRFFIAILALISLTFSCKKLEEISKINVPMNRTFTIPETELEQIPIDITTPKVSTADNLLNNNIDLEGDRLESVAVTSMELSIDSAQGIDLSYLESVELFFEAEDMDQERIAWAEDISSEVGYHLELSTSEADITPFLLEDSIRIRLIGLTDEAIEIEHELTVESILEIDVKLLGQ